MHGSCEPWFFLPDPVRHMHGAALCRGHGPPAASPSSHAYQHQHPAAPSPPPPPLCVCNSQGAVCQLLRAAAHVQAAAGPPHQARTRQGAAPGLCARAGRKGAVGAGLPAGCSRQGGKGVGKVACRSCWRRAAAAARGGGGAAPCSCSSRVHAHVGTSPLQLGTASAHRQARNCCAVQQLDLLLCYAVPRPFN